MTEATPLLLKTDAELLAEMRDTLKLPLASRDYPVWKNLFTPTTYQVLRALRDSVAEKPDLTVVTGYNVMEYLRVLTPYAGSVAMDVPVEEVNARTGVQAAMRLVTSAPTLYKWFEEEGRTRDEVLTALDAASRLVEAAMREAGHR